MHSKDGKVYLEDPFKEYDSSYGCSVAEANRMRARLGLTKFNKAAWVNNKNLFSEIMEENLVESQRDLHRVNEKEMYISHPQPVAVGCSCTSYSETELDYF